MPTAAHTGGRIASIGASLVWRYVCEYSGIAFARLICVLPRCSAAATQTTCHLDALPVGHSAPRTRGQCEGQLCARHGARTSMLNRRRRSMLPLRTVHPASSKRPPCCDALESQVHSCRNTLFEVVPPLFSLTICSIPAPPVLSVGRAQARMKMCFTQLTLW